VSYQPYPDIFGQSRHAHGLTVYKTHSNAILKPEVIVKFFQVIASPCAVPDLNKLDPDLRMDGSWTGRRDHRTTLHTCDNGKFPASSRLAADIITDSGSSAMIIQK
jgi:hypothetical protein